MKMYVEDINKIINSDNCIKYKEIIVNYPSGKIKTFIDIYYKDGTSERIELLKGKKPQPKRQKTLFDEMLKVGIMLENDPHDENLKKEYGNLKFKIVEKQLQELFNQ